ncbi:hypothetical protein OFM36_34315, partial [Escherichia coli]|nr:hypothetical protein [Escherichia coli]
IGLRIEGGVGIAFEDSFRHPRFAAHGGVGRGPAPSFDGLISHEIDVGALVIAGDGAAAIARISYRLNVEAGDWMLRPEVGPAYDIGE